MTNAVSVLDSLPVATATSSLLTLEIIAYVQRLTLAGKEAREEPAAL